MGKLSKEVRRQRQRELLTLFNQLEDHYEEKRVADRIYIKMFNGNTQRWQVAEFSPASYTKYTQFNQSRKSNRELDEELARKLAKP